MRRWSRFEVLALLAWVADIFAAGAARAAVEGTIMLDQHQLRRAVWMEGHEGILLASSHRSLEATLARHGLVVAPSFGCDPRLACCGPLALAPAQSEPSNDASLPGRLQIFPLQQLDDVGLLAWWIEVKDSAAEITCERPDAELWPLFVDGTAFVGRSWVTYVDGNRHQGPIAVWLRHDAGELTWDEHDSEAQSAGAPTFCRDFGPMPQISALEPKLQNTAIWHAAISKKRIALTFDACSTFLVGRFNPAVIAALEASSVPATLFVGGHWAEMYPQELERLAAHPLFEIGNHTYSHPHMRDLPPARQRQELLWTQQLIFSRTGLVPRFFRPPYGEVDDVMLAETARAGLTTVEYDLPAGDADVHVSAPKLVAWVTGHVSAGSVVIMHMNRPGNHTAEAIYEVAKQLRQDGYKFCRLSDLLAEESEGCL